MNLYSYNQYSESAKELAKAIGIKRIRHEGSRFRGRPDKLVINWGSSRIPEEVAKCKVFNNPVAINKCSNKLTFFKELRAYSENNEPVSYPDFTENTKEAFRWITEGSTVVARKVLQGHSAEGLVIMTNDPETHTEAPLYTKYIPKIDEYRIHLFKNGNDFTVVDLQRKGLRRDWSEHNEGKPNWKVRNHNNGFVFVREGVNPPDDVIEQSKRAMKAMGLDFGAVDVIWNQKRDKAYILEINTAPGLEGTTLENYTMAFKELI